ncbi:MAG: alpha/beta hydrolase-fold protein [Planctomycetota bacterium]|nr:alpha/beta hydrolase-fold protein [Planctomycetota bacterium]
MRYLLFILPMVAFMAGCPVTQSQDTPVSAMHLTETQTGGKYWLYVPSYYDKERDWPLVVTLHGTYGWDGAKRQVNEWKYLAEQRGLIVASPQLRSVQGILPVIKGLWFEDLKKDERMILSVVDDVSREYNVKPGLVLLTGFSAGGYPLYYTGLRNPKRFDMLIARGCNSSLDLFEKVELTDAARDLSVLIFWGKHDLKSIRNQGWQAFRYLREHQCFRVRRKEIRGGHLRRPDVAYQQWRRRLPKRHHR